MNIEIECVTNRKLLYDFINRIFNSSKVSKMTPMKFSNATDEFLQAKSLVLSQHTIADYRLTLRRARAFWKDDPCIHTLEARDVRGFLASIPGGKKNCLNAHIALSSLWTFSLAEGYVSEHIVHKVEAPEPDQKIIHPFVENDVREMLACVGRVGPRNHAMVLFLLDTGVRASELCNIKLSDIKGNFFKVMGKGSKEREVPLSDRGMQALVIYLQNRNGQNARYLFTTTGGLQYNRFTLLKLIVRMGERAGVENAHPHRFRHTFAINYLLNGGDAYSLQRILGHSTMEMVNRYLDFSRTNIGEIHRKASPVSNWNL